MRDSPASMVLAASSAILKRCPTLWLCTSGGPSSGKSPVNSSALHTHTPSNYRVTIEKRITIMVST